MDQLPNEFNTIKRSLIFLAGTVEVEVFHATIISTSFPFTGPFKLSLCRLYTRRLSAASLSTGTRVSRLQIRHKNVHSRMCPFFGHILECPFSHLARVNSDRRVLRCPGNSPHVTSSFSTDPSHVTCCSIGILCSPERPILICGTQL